LNWRKAELTLLLPPGTSHVLGGRADGRWIASIPQQATPQGLQVLLPIPTQGPSHHLEIIYLSEKIDHSWPFGRWLQAPAPQLPIAPMALQRRWRLPPGLVPLHGSAF